MNNSELIKLNNETYSQIIIGVYKSLRQTTYYTIEERYDYTTINEVWINLRNMSNISNLTFTNMI
jgi:hypothetical protein